jgi:predicted nucleic-acid-binding protein
MMIRQELNTQSEEALLGLMDIIAEDCSELSEDYEMTDEDAYIASIIMDHFVENYQHPTMREAVTMSLMGFDINDELYEEVIEIMLDESVGTFVAGAAHGIRNALSKYSASRASTAQKKAKMKSTAISKKYKDYTKSVKKTPIKKGVIGQAKAAYQDAKSIKLAQRADSSNYKSAQALSKSRSAMGKHQSDVQKSTNLNSIDVTVANKRLKRPAKLLERNLQTVMLMETK